MSRWFWAFTSLWDPPRDSNYRRHALAETDQLIDRIEAGRKWKPKQAPVIESTRLSRLEDFPFCMVPVLSERAASALNDLWSADGDFLKISLCKRGAPIRAKYYVYNCLRTYSAFDPVRSKADEDATIRAVYPSRLRPTLRLEYSRVPKSVNAFRCQGWMERLLVSERVVERLLESDLSGWMLADPEDPPWTRRSIISPCLP